MPVEPADFDAHQLGGFLWSQEIVLFDYVSTTVSKGGGDLFSDDLAEFSDRQLHEHPVICRMLGMAAAQNPLRFRAAMRIP